MKYCTNCGKEIDDKAVICPNCGVKQGANKSKVVAALLAFFLGGLGIHNFYLGYTTKGVIQLVCTLLGGILLFIPTLVVGVWAFVEFILILLGKITAADGSILD